MTMSRYQIVFSGQLVHGASSEQVQVNLARLFRADAARIAALFSGRRVLLKSNLDAGEAEKYRATLERAGARVDILPVKEEVQLAPAQEIGSLADRLESVRKPLVVAPRDSYMAAFTEVEVPDFGIAPVGADLQELRPEAVAPRLDLSGLSLAPVGSDIGQVSTRPTGPLPDISHLCLETP